MTITYIRRDQAKSRRYKGLAAARVPAYETPASLDFHGPLGGSGLSTRPRPSRANRAPRESICYEYQVRKHFLGHFYVQMTDRIPTAAGDRPASQVSVSLG